MRPENRRNRRFLLARLAAGFLIAWPALAGNARAARTLKPIVVRTASFTRVPEETLAKGEAVASDILRRAGVAVTWLNCPARFDSGHPCGREMDANEFWIRVVPGKISQPVLGSSLVADIGGQSKLATVMYHRLEDIQERSQIDVYLILGAVMTHEIGHLLLGTGHEPKGVMSTNWNDFQFIAVSRGELGFTRDQAQKLQVAVGTLRRSNKAKSVTGALVARTPTIERPSGDYTGSGAGTAR